MINSFRFRLTLWYLLFFSLLFVLFSLFLHGVLSHALERRLDEALAVEANTTAAMLQDEFEEMKGDVPAASSDAVSGMRLHGSLVAVLSGNRVLAASTPLPQPKSFKRWAWEWVKSIAIALVIWFVLRTLLVEAFRIPSSSMERSAAPG